MCDFSPDRSLVPQTHISNRLLHFCTFLSNGILNLTCPKHKSWFPAHQTLLRQWQLLVAFIDPNLWVRHPISSMSANKIISTMKIYPRSDNFYLPSLLSSLQASLYVIFLFLPFPAPHVFSNAAARVSLLNTSVSLQNPPMVSRFTE